MTGFTQDSAGVGFAPSVGQALRASMPEGQPDFLSDESRRFCSAFACNATVALTVDINTTVATSEFTRVVTCTLAGPAVLAHAWTLVSDSAATVQRLVALSARMSDKRILDAILGVASNRSTQLSVRRIALEQGAAQLHPRIASYASGRSAGRGSCGQASFVAAGAVQVAGAQAIEGDARPAGVGSLRKLQTSVESEELRLVAGFLANCVESMLLSSVRPRSPFQGNRQRRPAVRGASTGSDSDRHNLPGTRTPDERKPNQ